MCTKKKRTGLFKSAGLLAAIVILLLAGVPAIRHRTYVLIDKLRYPSPPIRLLTAAVGDRGPYFFDQHRARGFNGDAGQHSASCIFHRTGERALRARRRGKCKPRQHHDE